jgi:proliferating cell nuclear antigen
MSAFSQQRLLDEPDDTQCHVATSGRTIRPFFRPIDALVDECKLRASAGGLEVTAVDPANVAMVHIEAPAEAFDSYVMDGDADELVTGVALKDLRRCLSEARMGKRTDDPVEVSIGDGTCTAEVERKYERTTVRRYSEFLTMDPDSIRQEPDLPELGLSWSADLDTDALADAIEASRSVADHVNIAESDGDLVVTGVGDDDLQATRTTFEDVAEAVEEAEGGEKSAFSLDYLEDMTTGLVNAKVDGVTIRWDQEFPIILEFERTDEDDQILYEGQMMTAPRIQSD